MLVAFVIGLILVASLAGVIGSFLVESVANGLRPASTLLL